MFIQRAGVHTFQEMTGKKTVCHVWQYVKITRQQKGEGAARYAKLLFHQNVDTGITHFLV